jgi:SHS2 domain-containing protein
MPANSGFQPTLGTHRAMSRLASPPHFAERSGLPAKRFQERIMFELFDHTADLGIRVRAASPNELFAEAAKALTHCLVGQPDSVQTTTNVRCELESPDLEYLFFDWLSELLFRFDAEGFIVASCECRVDVQGTSLQATLHGDLFDPSRHEYSHEVKAITYHGLRVERDADGWLAEVIIDI